MYHARLHLPLWGMPARMDWHLSQPSLWHALGNFYHRPLLSKIFARKPKLLPWHFFLDHVYHLAPRLEEQFDHDSQHNLCHRQEAHKMAKLLWAQYEAYKSHLLNCIANIASGSHDSHWSWRLWAQAIERCLSIFCHTWLSQYFTVETVSHPGGQGSEEAKHLCKQTVVGYFTRPAASVI